MLGKVASDARFSLLVYSSKSDLMASLYLKKGGSLLTSEQFKIDGQWVPSLDRCSHVDREIVVKNAVGIWMAKTFPYQPMNIGVVTSQPMDPD